MIWNVHKFTVAAARSSGDFNSDGVVDGSDDVAWNSFTFASSATATMPEPGIPAVLLGLFRVLFRFYGRKEFKAETL